MSTIFLSPATQAGPKTSSDAGVLSAAAAPTTSYVATTNDAVCLGWDYVVFGVTYVNGDETSMQIKAQGYDGTTWRDLSFKAVQASNVSEITPDVLNLTKATFSTLYGAGASAAFATPPCSCVGFQLVRLVRKSTGGTPTGTLAFSVTGGIGGAGSRGL